MGLTERGRWTSSAIDERGRIISGKVSEGGQYIFTVSSGGIVGTPNVTIVSVSRLKVSDEIGVNQSVITITFDKDVTQYIARLNGVDYNTGVLVHSGGSALAGQQVQVIIDWNELTTEGQNRINIYGQGTDGTWTAYE